MKELSVRTKDAFSDKDEEKAKQYLDWLLPTLFDLTKTVRRNAILMLLLVSAFELVEESPHTAITLGGFRVDKSSVVLLFIPALVAYLYLEAMAFSAKIRFAQSLFTQVCKLWSPSVERNDLDLYVLPASSLFWNVYYMGKAENMTPEEKVEEKVSNVLAYAITLVFFTFEGEAYYVLLNSNRISFYVMYGLSLIVTAFCLSMIIIYVYFTN